MRMFLYGILFWQIIIFLAKFLFDFIDFDIGIIDNSDDRTQIFAMCIPMAVVCIIAAFIGIVKGIYNAHKIIKLDKQK